MKRILISVLIIFSVITAFTRENNQAVPYTLDDKDRMIKVETKLGALEDRVDVLDKSLNKRIDGLEDNIKRLEDKFDTYFTWGFGMVLGAIFALFGFGGIAEGFAEIAEILFYIFIILFGLSLVVRLVRGR